MEELKKKILVSEKGKTEVEQDRITIKSELAGISDVRFSVYMFRVGFFLAEIAIYMASNIK